MNKHFSEFNIKAEDSQALYAAELFKKELFQRTGAPVSINNGDTPNFHFVTCPDFENKDCFTVSFDDSGCLVFSAQTVRGLIYAYSRFLKKTTFKNGKNILIEDISGFYKPQKQIRGHQVGYRTTPNTYDAWDYDQYFQYYLDMMAFCANTVEHNGTKPDKNFRNALMKYEQYDFLVEASRLADEVDLDVSLWHANSDNETEEEALRLRDELYKNMPRLNIVFPPGGDPGKLPADVFVDRCKKISEILRKHHPDALMHPSAQAPHEYRDWGEVFTREMAKKPDGIDAVIMGPNHAFPMHELRKKIDSKYPLRFYPDITHNLRCEYPVNFLEDDWHYTYAATLSRESVNPRPLELRTLHRLFSPYTVGSVSYSEGVHDDLNKAIWSALEFDCNTPLREIVTDYARYYLHGADEEKFADCIFMLEKNWQSPPEENPVIDLCYNSFCELKRDYPHLSENWRFVMHYFRACCDKLVKDRRVFELELCRDAEDVIMRATKSTAEEAVKNALEIFKKPFSEKYNDLRREIDELGEKLFKLIGLQLDVEHYCADSWERGATLDTIDNNVTDKAYLIAKLTHALEKPADEMCQYAKRLFTLRKSRYGEVYYSVALHNLNTLGVSQKGEFYMDVYADKPFSKEKSMPMAMTKLFDHFNFEAKFGGFLPETDYTLTVVYRSDNDEEINRHTVTANGRIIHCGKQFGGAKNPDFDKDFLVEGFESAAYTLPRECFENGTLELTISEPTEGFKLCEMWIAPIK